MQHSHDQRRIDELFDLASDLPPEERAEFLSRQCDGDTEVRAEVERLLQYHDRAGVLDSALLKGADSFQEKPASPSGESVLVEGTLLAGRFRVGRLLGSGGMGSVYECEDVTSSRHVALKTIRGDLASDSRLIDRLRKELLLARTVSHPNVCKVHEYWDVEDHGGMRRRFFTMELLHGETLDRRIAGRRLTARETLIILRQVASGLDEVHHLGILHRDLKPSNVCLVPEADGSERAVIMDFGLARTLVPGDATQTQTGAVMGTPAYMAPESFGGGSASKAADVFSFGVMAFEMITGSNHPLVAPRSIVKNLDPIWDRVLLQCFDRAPEMRPTNLVEVVSTLERGSRRWQRMAIAASSLALCGVCGAAAWIVMFPPAKLAPAITQVTFDSGFTTDPAVSADGKVLVYSSDRGERGDLNIWSERLDTGETHQVSDDPGDEDDPSVSPDGKLAAYVSESKKILYVKPVSGGPEREIAPWGDDPAFSPDGKMLAYWTGQSGERSTPSGRIWVVPVGGGVPRRLAADLADARLPAWSPDGRHILFRGARSSQPSIDANLDFWITDIAGREVDPTGAGAMLRKAGVTPHDSPSLWDGKNVIFAGRAGHGVNLLTFKLPSYLGRAFGRPQALTTSGGFQAVPAKLSDGRILFADWREQSHIWKVNPSTGQPSQLTFQDSIDTKVSCSRDGSVIVFGRRLGDVRNVWTKDLRVGVERELAANELAVPFVSPSGRKTALSAGVTMRILEMATGKQSVVCTSCGELMSWVPDESGLLFLIESDEHTAEIKKLDLRTNSSKTLISGEGLREASLSPNGRTIAFTARQAGVRSRIFIQSLGDGAVGSRWKPVTDKDGWADKPVWSNDGRTLFYDSRRDGFRCIWSQRIKSDMSGPDGGPKAILHLHKPTFTLSHYSNTALGLAGAAGSLFLTVDSAQSNIWAVQP